MGSVAALGPLELRAGDGGLVPLPSRRHRRLLAALTLHANTGVSDDDLVELVWSAEVPAHPAAALQTNVARLRRLLPSPLEIVTEPRAYRLVVDPGAVDVARFTAHLGAADGSRDAAERLRHLDAALSLWRGQPYADLEHVVVAPEVARLAELRLSAVEARAEALLELGRTDEAIAALEALTLREPFRERPVGALMRALASAGRQRDALRAYTRLRTTLAEDLGIDPSPELRDLEDRLLRQELGEPGTLGAPVTAGTPGRCPGNLPQPLDELIGRDDDLARIAGALASARLVTLTGPGGVGKTHLAFTAAHALVPEFRDGGWLVSLVSCSSDADVPIAATSDLSLVVTGSALDADGVARAVGSQRRLLVVDNCEHVIDGASDLVERLLVRCPEVRILATSREPLRLAGERTIAVEPLSLDASQGMSDAAQLFCRAVTAQPFRPTPDDLAEIEEVCARLDGVPLAIELTAGRVHALGVAGVRAEIDERIHAAARRRGPRRHQSLDATVRWSYDLLAPDERTVLERLSVFTDGFSREAAVAVAGAPPLARPVEDALVSLVERSLVAVDHQPHVRYRQLEIVRQFAADRLAESGGRDACLDRLCAYYVRWIRDADEGARGVDEAEWDRRFRAEWGNLRRTFQRAVETGDVDAAVTIVWHAHWWASQRSVLELGEWAQVARTMPCFERHEAAAIVLAAGADAMRQRFRYREYRTLLAEAEAIERAHGPAPEPWVPLLAVLRNWRFGDADPLTASSEVERRAGGSPFWAALAAWADGWCVWLRASTAACAADDDEDVRRVERGLALAEELGNPSVLARALEQLGIVLRRRDPLLAVEVLRRALRLAAELGNDEIDRFVRWDLSMVLGDLGRHPEAASVLLAGIDHHGRAEAAIAWDLCTAAFRLLVAVGLHRPATLMIARLRLDRIAAEIAEIGAPSAVRERLERETAPDDRRRWLEEGRRATLDELIREVTAALEAVTVGGAANPAAGHARRPVAG